MEYGSANLLSFEWLEVYVIQVNKETKGWMLITPGGQKLCWKQDASMLKGFPYIELSDLKEVCELEIHILNSTMVQTI